MGRKGKKGGKKRGDSDDDEPVAAPAPAEEPEGNKKHSRKQKRAAKQAQRQQHNDDDDDDDIANLLGGKKNQFDDDDEDDDDDDYAPPPKQQQQKGKQKKGKGKKNQRRQDSDDDDDDEDMAALLSGGAKNKYGVDDDDDDDEDDDYAPPPKQQPKGKQKKKGKKNQRKQDSDDDDDDDDDMAALLGGGAKNKFAVDDDDDDDDDDEEEIPQPVKEKNKKNKGKPAAAMAAFMASDSEDDDDDDSEDDDDDDGNVEQIAFKIADDFGDKKKKKKDKKEKKEKKKEKKIREGEEDLDEAERKRLKKERKALKKEKKEKKALKKEKKAAAAGDGDVDDVADDMEKINISEQPKKSKLELQIEAAMKKKDEAEATPKVEEEVQKIPMVQQVDEDETEEETKDEEDDQLMYGAPDDVVWSDKSHAQREAENNAGTEEINLTHGPDGKKLSNKERKRLLKAKQAAERAAEFEKAAAESSREGAQFACSQTAVNENDPQWQNSLDINIPNFSISAAGKILFKDAALTIGHGRRYGLVGPNGRGKSTLLKMIASHDLKLPPRIDFLYVEQEVVADDTPAVEAVLKADKKRWDLLAEEKALMKDIDAGDESEEKIERLQFVIDELTNMGADSADAKARRILFGLGFTLEMQTKPTKMFSGGWRMRISLARALFVEPTLLMLDEPTNHLDLNAVIWLDEYLQKWKKTLLIVSHDQDFLNSVCQEILHIEDLKLASYKGDYDSFKRAEKEKFMQQVKAWEKQEKRLKELKRSGQSKAKAQEAVKKNSKREAGARSQKKKNQAIAAGTESAEVEELIKRPREYTVKLEFAEVAELSRPVLEVNNVHFRYSPRNPIIFDEIDFGIDMDSRICVVGPNGAGKSTLLKLLTGEVNATKGDVKRNPKLRMGIYNQHFVDRLPMSKTPVEHLRDRFNDESYQSVRNRLGKYGLEGHAHEVAMRDLSGGQKARVVFVELSLQEPHVLLLDEPTNNLDIETIDALVDAINEFNGGIVVVTHDQRLIEYCECDLWVVEKRGVTKWEAGFDDYKESILKELEEQVEREAAARRKKLEANAVARAEKMARLAGKVKRK